MFHSNTEVLMDYWRVMKGDDALPARTSIDPAHFAPLLSQVFIAGRRMPGSYPLRLAGEFVIDLFGKALRGEDLARLFAPAHRVGLQLALERILRHPEPLVIAAEGRTDDGLNVKLEILFAPIAGPDGVGDRVLGLIQPTSAVAPLRGRPVREILIRAIGGAQAAPPARLRLAALDGRRIA